MSFFVFKSLVPHPSSPQSSPPHFITRTLPFPRISFAPSQRSNLWTTPNKVAKNYEEKNNNGIITFPVLYDYNIRKTRSYFSSAVFLTKRPAAYTTKKKNIFITRSFVEESTRKKIVLIKKKKNWFEAYIEDRYHTWRTSILI